MNKVAKRQWLKPNTRLGSIFLVLCITISVVCGDRDLSSIPGLGRSPGEGKGYPLQYSGLGNSMDCIVHGVAKSWTWLSDSLHFIGKKEFPEPCVDNSKTRSAKCIAKLIRAKPLVRTRVHFPSCHLDWGLKIKFLEYATVHFLKLAML